MNKTLCKLCCCFIVKKRNRVHFMKKHLSPSLDSVSADLSSIRQIVELNFDVTKIPPAQGNLKLIQDSSVALLNHFNDICRKHNIKYWLDSGTLIGYVRHNGFIPWDDDIDVCMLREDYEKLHSILDLEFGDGFKYAHGEITRLYYKNTPAQVDVFPVDIGYKKDILQGEERKRFIQTLNLIKSQMSFKWEMSLSQLPACSKEEVEKTLAQKSTLFNGLPSVEKGFLFFGIETGVKNRCLFSWEDVFPLKEANFLGIDCYIPQNEPYYLYSLYGDYMVIPSHAKAEHSDIIGRLTMESYKNCQALIKKYYPRNSDEVKSSR